MKLEDCVFDRLRLEDSETQSLVVSTLVEANYAVAASVDNHILLALGAYGLAPEIITPSLVREALRSRSSLYVNLDRTAKLRLLGFVLKDNDFRDMAGLQLLPVADGSFARVSCSKNERNLYMPTEDFPSSLLPTLTAFLIRTDDMDEHLLYKVKKMAQEGMSLAANAD